MLWQAEQLLELLLPYLRLKPSAKSERVKEHVLQLARGLLRSVRAPQQHLTLFSQLFAALRGRDARTAHCAAFEELASLKAVRACDGLDDKLPQLECRLLIMHGTADEMTDFKGSLKLFGIAGSKDKELHLYKDCLHGLHYGECAAVCASVERDIARFVHGAEPVTTVIEHAESNGWEGEVKY